MNHCPVCGRRVDWASAPSAAYEGKIYYFRCPTCKERFLEEPEKFLREGPQGCKHSGQMMN